ncbi:MAG: transporter substrate-binding domain-containing protein [Oscillospiraceae bacterium]|nr:transporter substrate-binding domain-containing protein [Oscillospiraceae bacterium]
MKIPKILCGVLAGIIAVSMAGCEKDTSDTEVVVQSRVDSNSIIMATNAEFPPYEFKDGENIVGIDIEIARAIADDLGLELVIDDMAFDSILEAVKSGKADMAVAGLTVDDERLAKVNFSVPYTTATQVVIIKAGNEIDFPGDLVGKKVGVQLGTTGAAYAGDIEDAVVEEYNKGNEAVQALADGKIDAVIIDREPAKVFVDQIGGLTILDEEFTIEDYAIAVSKENDELLEKINTSLENLESSGKLKEIIDKYISAE